MRNLFLKSFIVMALVASGAAYAAAKISGINISYSRLLLPVDRQGYAIPQAIIGGNVNFDGTAPIFVTLIIGGQRYTSPADRAGNFSFLAYTNGAGDYKLEAWTTEAPAEGTAPSFVVNSQLK